MLFDTHAHLDHAKFDRDRDELIESFRQSGVAGVVNVGTDIVSSFASVELSNRYDFICASVGVHPHEVDKLNDELFAKVESLSLNSKVVAIGEIGLDYFYERASSECQMYWFKRHIDLAKRINKPIIIHCREAFGDCWSILNEKNVSNGVMHCFSGSVSEAAMLIDLGFYISFTGIITFSNAKQLQEVVESVPQQRILLETDCPFLAPAPYRGERNHCGYVKYVAKKIAEIKGLSFEELSEITADNAKRFFGINFTQRGSSSG